MNNKYFAQAELMLNVLTSMPFDNFALKGGTAINFFYENMPRYSVDIDLTWTKISPRDAAITEIHNAMKIIEQNLKKLNFNTVLLNANKDNPAIKLNVTNQNASVIIEPNTTLRGNLLPVEIKNLTEKSIKTFKVSGSIPCLAYKEVYAGKLTAMISRQHPRDIFDMYLYLRKNNNIKDLMDCFIAYLAQGNRPFSELLNPNETDITRIYETDFYGMTIEKISIDLLIETRKTIFSQVKKYLTNSHKSFLISLLLDKPEYHLMPFDNLSSLPAIQWKLQNISKMNNEKRKKEIMKLEV